MHKKLIRIVASPADAGIWTYACLVCAIFMAYGNVYGNAFVYDDLLLIMNNPALQSWSGFVSSLSHPLVSGSSYYRPLQILIYKIVFQFAGASLFAFHFLNVGLHAVNAGLLYRLGLKLDFKPLACFVAALLWAVHPVQTEAVTYMSALADTLYVFFCLWGVIVLLPDFAPRRILAAAALMILALLSKEAAYVFPLLAASCFYLKSDRRLDWKAYIRLWPLFFIAVAYVGIHVALLPPHTSSGASAPQAEAITVAAYPVAELMVYLRLLVWPAHLHMAYDLPAYASPWHADVLGGLALVFGGSFQIFYFLQRRVLPLNWGLCWFGAAYLPCLFLTSIFYEHWLYLPSAGLFLGFAQSVALLVERMDREKRKTTATLATIGALLISAIMGALTYKQNEIWREPVAFYNNTIQQGERAAKQHINLGVIYAERGAYDKAIAEDRIAIQNSHDTEALAQGNLAAVLLMLPDKKNHDDEALAHFQRALEIDPHSYFVLDALAKFYDRRGDSAKAAFYRGKADKVR